MNGDRSRQGRRVVRADVHARFLAVRARADAEHEVIRQAWQAVEDRLPKSGRWRGPKGTYQQYFIEAPEALVSAPVELGVYQDEVVAG